MFFIFQKFQKALQDEVDYKVFFIMTSKKNDGLIPSNKTGLKINCLFYTPRCHAICYCHAIGVMLFACFNMFH